MRQNLETPYLPLGEPHYRHVVFADTLAARRRPYHVDDAARQPPAHDDDVAAAHLSQDELGFLRWLFAESRLRLDDYRLRTLKRRIPACLRVLRAASFAEARRILAAKPSLLPRALSTLVIGVTSFFRDPAVFQLLRDDALPGLVSGGRHGPAVWCVGCSDGAELYSVAMILAEMGVLERCHLLGTDCRADAIHRARAGTFDAGAVRGLHPGLLRKYFDFDAGRWTAKPVLRDAAHWRTADVLSLHEPGVWDMILCRNLSIYLAPEAAAGLWPRLESSLRPGGVLVLGKAERPNGTRQLDLAGPCIYRRSRG